MSELVTFIDGGGTNGINKDVTRFAHYSKLHSYNNELYCAWRELNSSGIGQTRVAKYNGSSWVFVDGGGVNGINYSSSWQTYEYPNMCVFNNELYCTWTERTSSNIDNIRVKKYNGTSWTWADGGGVSGINYATGRHGYNSHLHVYNNELYCTWTEANSSNIAQIRVKKYNGTSWSWADGGGANGINYSTSRHAIPYSLHIYNNELYCAWREDNASSVSQIRVRKYNGTSWTFIDGGGVNGINYSTSRNGTVPVLYTFNNELYCAWQESTNAPNQIRVRKYNGSSWIWVDGGDSVGINYNTGHYAYTPVLTVFREELYCVWLEAGVGGPVGQIRLAKYLDTSWIFVDGGGFYGLNYNTNEEAGVPDIFVFNDTLYITWREHNGTEWQIRVVKFNFVILLHLLKHNSNILTLTDNSWFNTLLTEPLTQENFEEYGMKDLTVLSDTTNKLLFEMSEESLGTGRLLRRTISTEGIKKLNVKVGGG